MPDVKIIKLKVRRGTDSQRKTIILEQGELGYTIDTKRLFIGDGLTYGGNIIGSTVHLPTAIDGNRTATTAAIKGDIIYDTNTFYQLTGSNYSQLSSWKNVGQGVDNTSISYTVANKLQIATGGITPSKFGATSVYSAGGIIANTTSGLSANVDGRYVVLSGNKITISPLSADKISQAAISKGLQGGDGQVISINADSNYFGFNTNTLTLTALPSNTVTVNTLSSGLLGAGLITTGGVISTTLNSTNGSFDVYGGQLRLTTQAGANFTSNFENITVDASGIVTSKASMIYETLSGAKLSAYPNTVYPASSSLFNGSVDQVTYTNQTIVNSISANAAGTTALINLTSAGFMSIYTNAGYLAIPVFKYI